MSKEDISYFNISSIDVYSDFHKLLNLGTNNIIFLSGDIGSGKTTFVKSFIQSFSKKNVSSPTFSIINEYKIGSHLIYHYDLYRIKKDKELFEIGIDEYFSEEAIHFIEWPEKFLKILPDPSYLIHFYNYDPYRIVKLHKYDK